MNGRKVRKQTYSHLERELAIVLLKISETTESIARNLMILKAQRKKNNMDKFSSEL